MIQFENVSKRYGQFDALNNVSFHIQRGEMCFLTGHSGAGKSTLLKLISLREQASAGKVHVDGHDVSHLTLRKQSKLRSKMGIISQNPLLLNDLSVFDNVALPLQMSGFLPREIGRRVRAAFDKVGLLRKEKQLPPTLSSGEQQRVGVARAVVNKPHVLLADEPTGNLDPVLSAEIMRLFEAFHRVGVSVLIASHDLALIGQMKHRILTIHQGRMVSTGVKFVDESL
jgi:cell division transport system ATP-binding protein